jgi:photosynthetic reaction center H subunit
VTVKALKASQFAGVPATKDPDRVTLLEEDKIAGYYGGGTLFATPQRSEPLI